MIAVQNCDLFLYLGGESDAWVNTILESIDFQGTALRLIDCVDLLEEEHIDGMTEMPGHDHDHEHAHDDHDHGHDLGAVKEYDEHVWTSPRNAALITRGIAELARLGTAMGCQEQTFLGLAGIGDLIVTATSMHSRNNRCGMLLGQGVAPADAIKQVGMVVEGINALPAAMRLAEKYGVEMPLATAVNGVVNQGADPRDAVAKLMSRDQTSEI
jgi:hypothetical protein